VKPGKPTCSAPRLAATPDLARRLLVQLDVKGLSLSRPLYRMSMRGRRESAATSAFIELVARAAQPAKTSA